MGATHAKPRRRAVPEIMKAKILYASLLTDSTKGNSNLTRCAVREDPRRSMRLGHNDVKSTLIEIGCAVVSVFGLTEQKAILIKIQPSHFHYRLDAHQC